MSVAAKMLKLKKKSSQTAFIQYFGNSLYNVYHEKLGDWKTYRANPLKQYANFLFLFLAISTLNHVD